MITFRGRTADCKGREGQLTTDKPLFAPMKFRCYFTALHECYWQLNVAVAGIQCLHCHDVEPGPRPLQSQRSHNPVPGSMDLERRLGNARPDFLHTRLSLSGPRSRTGVPDRLPDRVIAFGG